jgi:hypothetical protein
MLRITGEFGIENPRNYPATLVSELRESLNHGVSEHPDPERENFYDVCVENRVFFIYISPSSGSVTLLAAWLDCSVNLSRRPGLGGLAFEVGVNVEARRFPY